PRLTSFPTRRASDLTGEAGLYGEFLADAQGEDVVAGIRTPEPLERMEKSMPGSFEQLTATMRRLEEHYRDVQDIEAPHGCRELRSEEHTSELQSRVD